MQRFSWLLKYIIIISCAVIITLSTMLLVRAVPTTTMIGENMATNNLDVTGTATVTGNITATGTVESTGGGIKFPDGTIQTTEAVTQVGTLTPEYMYPDDLGKNWKNLGTITAMDEWGSYASITSSAYLGGGIVIVAADRHIFKSTDYGVTWYDLGQKFIYNCYALSYLGNGIIIAGAGLNVYRSIDYGITWTDLGAIEISYLYSLKYLGNGIVLLGGMGLDVNEGRVFRSTDYGLTWTLSATFINTDPDSNGSTSTIEYLENGIVIAGSGINVYRSTDYGVTWNNLGAFEMGNFVMSSSYLGNGIALFGIDQGYIYRSIDYGLTWTYMGNFSVTDVNVITYLGNGIVLYGNCDAEILRSTDYGLTWTNLGIVIDLMNTNIRVITYLGNGVMVAAGDAGAIARSDISFKLNESQSSSGAFMIKKDVTASRLFDTEYRNNIGKPMQVNITFAGDGVTDAVLLGYTSNTSAVYTAPIASQFVTISTYSRTLSFLVLPREYYKIVVDDGTPVLLNWYEWM